MSEGVVTETGVRARTRRAILDAAIETLIKQPSATLADIAAAANVGRTTVHRYFAERSDLIDAISHDALDKVSQSTERARLDDGPARTRWRDCARSTSNTATSSSCCSPCRNW
ncbi:TetR/AcrR family transcriptional regulator [Amycolatopsis sp. EV170708-02-1]|uniref:TetR/AcrR family transcriptional regulator n=1 Tax=Amycolatopsis sp. EV170708-02-1 TaxID=2919322 RepID=UPI001F0BAA6F|nr:TetR/AcrR family transcriptional regulator [Amycolatopsis sp. EV170708-02-1]UMO99431.1 TetR/AcrR family transcriptional regulator [Amycolatopsis sp. EV170708-02-1]